LDLGCEEAGFETFAIVESDATARSTVEANAARYFPHLQRDALFGDITSLDPYSLLDSARADVGEVDLVHGGPPCTPFSKSGYWLEYKRAGADPRASLIDDFVRVVERLQPRAFLMENVYGLAYRNQNRAVFMRFLEMADRAGYAVDHRIVLAADYGVPQLRQRLVCVGLRKDLVARDGQWRFKWPTPTHSGPHETRVGWNTELPPHKSSGEALVSLSADRNLPEPEEVVRGTYEDEFVAVPSGQNYLFWTAERGHVAPRFTWRSRYWSFLLKLHPDRPSPTIQGQPGPWVGPFHWENRRLRVPEVKRLMTFPDEFVVLGSRREQQLQLGNAVPPQLGFVIANAIAHELASRRGARRVAIAA
jgi:DNA (cytosine-5)-methyltransferase 1